MAVSWSDGAEADLENINSTVKDQLRRNAEVTLPDIRDCTGRERVGNGEIMWHRGITYEQEREPEWLWEEDDDGARAWDYVLFYRRRTPTEFEVLGVRSTRQSVTAGPVSGRFSASETTARATATAAGRSAARL